MTRNDNLSKRQFFYHRHGRKAFIQTEQDPIEAEVLLLLFSCPFFELSSFTTIEVYVYESDARFFYVILWRDLRGGRGDSSGVGFGVKRCENLDDGVTMV